jgi:hypothetical protein
VAAVADPVAARENPGGGGEFGQDVQPEVFGVQLELPARQATTWSLIPAGRLRSQTTPRLGHTIAVHRSEAFCCQLFGWTAEEPAEVFTAYFGEVHSVATEVIRSQTALYLTNSATTINPWDLDSSQRSSLHFS